MALREAWLSHFLLSLGEGRGKRCSGTDVDLLIRDAFSKESVKNEKKNKLKRNKLVQLSVKTDARSEFLRAPPVTLLPLFKKTHGHGAWPRAAQDFKILEPFFFPSDSFNGLTCVSRGSAALPPPCVLPKKV